ncbi:MAG: hypothetical protein ACOX5W_01920 [Bacillota bacterium]|jgi:hypothetical protein
MPRKDKCKKTDSEIRSRREKQKVPSTAIPAVTEEKAADGTTIGPKITG